MSHYNLVILTWMKNLKLYDLIESGAENQGV